MPVHLQSLLGKKEIRRFLDGLDSRMARAKAMRLSVIAQTFFAFLNDVQNERIRFRHGDNTQCPNNIRQIACVLDTFWFDTAMKENLSPATLALRLPSFLQDAGLQVNDGRPVEQEKRHAEVVDVPVPQTQTEEMKRHVASSPLKPLKSSYGRKHYALLVSTFYKPSMPEKYQIFVGIPIDFVRGCQTDYF
ncbi:MAG: hypothetical protein LBC94_07345 [Desulfovibrio sp.]|nr:hypothetical protein [Desulfovibrio sp.]